MSRSNYTRLSKAKIGPIVVSIVSIIIDVRRHTGGHFVLIGSNEPLARFEMFQKHENHKFNRELIK